METARGRHKKAVKQSEEYTEEYTEEGSEEYSEESSEEPVINPKDAERLKAKVESWMDYDDAIKKMSAKMKKYKDAKKSQEDSIMKMIEKFKLDEKKIDVNGKDNKIRGRVYRYESVTKEAIKEETIRDVLMEAIKNENNVRELVKKINERRNIKKRYYLKRTKGGK